MRTKSFSNVQNQDPSRIRLVENQVHFSRLRVKTLSSSKCHHNLQSLPPMELLKMDRKELGIG
jgi:hypothetical protein